MVGDLRINSAARFHCAPDWSWDSARHPMPDRDLWVVVAGSGTAMTNAGEILPLARGDTFVLDASRTIRAGHDPDDPLTVIAVHFEGGASLPFHARVRPIEFLAGTLDRMLRCRLLGHADASVRWLRAALDEVRATAEDAARPADRAATGVMELADRIRDRPGDEWRVSSLAHAAGVTPQHLGRLFRDLTGRSPKEYVLQARIEAACAYLRGSSLPVKRIASELGFHDEFHFSRAFGQRVGMSPSAYRSQATP